MNQQANHEVEDKAEDQMSQIYYKHNTTKAMHATCVWDTWIKMSLLLEQFILYISS
jgi:hypothetical protein